LVYLWCRAYERLAGIERLTQVGALVATQPGQEAEAA
jgi:hypothetical protein